MCFLLQQSAGLSFVYFADKSARILNSFPVSLQVRRVTAKRRPRTVTPDLQVCPQRQRFDALADLRAVADEVATLSNSAHRSLDCLDLFSGNGGVSAAFRSASYTAEEYDIGRDRHCDITAWTGFRRALELLVSVKPRGLVVAAPPCSLFTFLSSSYHRRTVERPEGDETKESVRTANLVVRNLVLLLYLATERNVHWIVEQPSSSRVWIYWPMRECLEHCSAQRCWTTLGSYGHDLPKATVLWGTLPTLALLSRRTKRPRSSAIDPQQHRSTRGRGRSGSSDYYRISASGAVSGGRDLHSSAHYPEGLCRAILSAFQLSAEAATAELPVRSVFSALVHSRATASRGQPASATD